MMSNALSPRIQCDFKKSQIKISKTSGSSKNKIMKYTKLIIVFLFINLLLVFSMIFIANNTREIEKKNNNLKIRISNIADNLKINKIELATYKNNSYLKELYSLLIS